MECRKCNEVIEKDVQFCKHCGTKVLKERITFRFLLKELFISFGWDSYFIVTIKKMFTSPQTVLSDYLGGIRKRYLNPFTYLAISTALSLLIFNFFADDFIALQNSFNNVQLEELKSVANRDLSQLEHVTAEELQKLQYQKKIATIQLKIQDKIMSLFFKYFNLFVFLLIPLYALTSYWTYKKTYNYGEHIIMNSYLVGTSMYISVVIFFIALLIHPKIYFFNVVVFTAYYLYTLNKLHRLNLKQRIFSFLRFVAVLMVITILLCIVLGVLIFIVGLIFGLNNPGILK